MVARPGVGIVRPSQRKPGSTRPPRKDPSKQGSPEDLYFHARWRPETQLFFKFLAEQSNKPAVFWQQQVIEAFCSIRPWEANPEAVRFQKVPAKETVQVLFRIGRVVEQVNELSAQLGVRPNAFVRAGAEWGATWIPKVYGRLVGEPWQPAWSRPEYQAAVVRAAS